MNVLKEILFNVPRVSFYGFLMSIAKSERINEHIGRNLEMICHINNIRLNFSSASDSSDMHYGKHNFCKALHLSDTSQEFISRHCSPLNFRSTAV